MKNKEYVLLKTLIEENVRKELFLIKEAEFNDPLLNIFVQPFTDIIDTARAGLEKVAATTWTHIGSLAKQAVALAVPFLSSDVLDELQKNAEEQIEKQLATIDSKYGPVLKRNYDTMRDRDLWGVAFLFNPQLFLGFKTAIVAPEVALSVLEALTGGHPTIVAMKQKLSSINQRTVPSNGWDTGGSAAYGYDLGYYDLGFGDGMFESLKRKSLKEIYFEQQVQQPQQQQKPLTKKDIDAHLNKQIMAVSKDPGIQQSINNSPVTKQMKNIAVNSVMKTAQEIASLKTYEDFKQYFGEDFQKFENEFNRIVGEQPTPEQENEFKKQFVPQLRKSVLDMYAKQIQMMASKFPMISKQLNDIANQIKSF